MPCVRSWRTRAKKKPQGGVCGVKNLQVGWTRWVATTIKRRAEDEAVLNPITTPEGNVSEWTETPSVNLVQARKCDKSKGLEPLHMRPVQAAAAVCVGEIVHSSGTSNWL